MFWSNSGLDQLRTSELEQITSREARPGSSLNLKRDGRGNLIATFFMNLVVAWTDRRADRDEEVC